MTHVVVIGAGQAGAALVAKLRGAGHTGQITLIAGDLFAVTRDDVEASGGPIDGVYDRAALIALPPELSRYVVEKGSITVDGISLTVSGLGDDWFEVSLIPTTLALTTLGRAPVGATVNLEVDVIAKYVERLLGERAR